ncbi:helix-turn-helix transcriptional regulator [Brevibacillus reuszeri]|uniref:helix-turn-helix transcriptional regulator n=1 Tax=Brevibacillus reuszeri TaxID=54915 RepID=UPI003D2627C6
MKDGIVFIGLKDFCRIIFIWPDESIFCAGRTRGYCNGCETAFLRFARARAGHLHRRVASDEATYEDVGIDPRGESAVSGRVRRADGQFNRINERSVWRKGLEKLLEIRNRILVTDYRSKVLESLSLKEKLQAFAVSRTSEGYMADIIENPDGSFYFIEKHCPVCEAAKACTGICNKELEMFQEVLGEGTQITRGEHILKGGGCTRVSAALMRRKNEKEPRAGGSSECRETLSFFTLFLCFQVIRDDDEYLHRPTSLPSTIHARSV